MTLRDCFERHQGRPIGKIDHFFDVYESHFSSYIGTKVRVLEIGVHKGGSLELWQTYFGPDAIIHGIDIDPAAANVTPKGTTVHIGSQVDDLFIQTTLDAHGPFDIVIDDGSHMMDHQITTFKKIYPQMADGGVYVCEDAFTSYWQEYGGKLRGPDTFMEYTKTLIDELHADWALDADFNPTPFTRMTAGLHIYSGAVVFERARNITPVYVVKEDGKHYRIPIAKLKEIAADELG